MLGGAESERISVCEKHNEDEGGNEFHLNINMKI